MIQDFASVFVVGKQAVRGRAVPMRGDILEPKILGAILTGVTMVGITASLIFYLLIQSGHHALAAQTTTKAEMVKAQNGLYGKREALLDQKAFAKSAEKLGLYEPESHQLRRL